MLTRELFADGVGEHGIGTSLADGHGRGTGRRCPPTDRKRGAPAQGAISEDRGVGVAGRAGGDGGDRFAGSAAGVHVDRGPMRRSFAAAAVATFGLAGSWLSPAGGASAGDTGSWSGPPSAPRRRSRSVAPTVPTGRRSPTPCSGSWLPAGSSSRPHSGVQRRRVRLRRTHGRLRSARRAVARQRVQRVGLRDPSRARPRLGRGGNLG